MCGIVGVVGQPGTPALARQVLAALKHRGPDDEGVEFFSDGWMAHTRLSIIDLSPLGRQPMANARGTVWITYNGEIYNYVELRRELQGYPFRTHTDTEVILAAYDRWGLDCLRHLRGMFAFGLWDAPRKRLLCATDRFSIKPLYYHHDGTRFIFSSEATPIALCGVPLRPNAPALYDYLAFGLVDHGSETLFEGISQLRPGTYVVVQDGHVAVRRYWDLEHAAESSDPGASEQEVEATLIEALRLHLRGDVEVGLSLSSGLDSNVLRALLTRMNHRATPLQCFTYSFPGTPYDEAGPSSGAAADDGCVRHAVELSPGSLLDELGDLVDIMEGPVGGLGIYGYWRSAKLAADHGIKVLLDGQGADETFAGYRYYYDLKVQQLWARGDRAAAVEEFHRISRAHGEPAKDFGAWLAARPTRAMVMAPDSTLLTSGYAHPDFAAPFSAREPVFPGPSSCAVKNGMYRDLFFLKIPKLLRFQDKCAMAWGVEVRVPYLDHVLVETLATVPTTRLLHGGVTKPLLRTIAKSYLPEERLRPTKLYVSAPQREWIKTALKPAIEQMIQESVLAEHGYILKEALRRQFQAYAASPELGNSFFIWKFMNLELWYRRCCVSQPLPVVG